MNRINRAPWLLLGGLAVLAFTVLGFIALAIGLIIVHGAATVSVSTLGMDVSGLQGADLIARLNSWNALQVRDDTRRWTVAAADLGIQLYSNATAAQLQTGASGPVQPVLSVDLKRAQRGLQQLAAQVNRPAVNATVRYVNGQLTVVPPVEGRALDVTATLARLQANAAREIASGTLTLSVNSVAPAISDATPLLAKARTLLAAPLNLTVYNPITNKTQPWTLDGAQWGQWLTVSTGSQFSVDAGALGDYLKRQSALLGSNQHLDLAQAITDIQTVVGNGMTKVTLRVYNAPTTYTVQTGDTLGTIAWKAGIPMWRINRANPGVNTNALAVGQPIALPSKDDLLPLPIVYGKRIVISISKQHMWVYENGQVKWDWVTSTGIADSPTMPGVFQVQSHDKNAYGALWNLWMPNFMGIYEAVPGFMNGIHGLPTLSGGRLLWAGFLGRPITYGCILLSLDNALMLYNWTPDGVVVEIQP